MPMSTVNVRYMVDDVDAAVAWYTKHLGFTLLSNAATAFADVTLGSLRLLLSGPTSSAGRPMPDGERPGPGGWNRIHLIVDDISAEVARLRAAGVEFRNDIVTAKGTIPCTNPSATQQERFMATIRYVSAASDIPENSKYVLVELGSENRLSRHSRGLTVTIDRLLPSNLLEAHTETAIGEAQAIADQEDIDTVFIALPKRP
jgi:catechol 2,3-dioxygenase-like lactoylglutathione lyase family enzyme